MNWTLEVTGLNLEKCLTLAARAGIVLSGARRLKNRALRVSIPQLHMKAFQALCEAHGWSFRVVRRGTIQRALDRISLRPALPAAAALFLICTWCSSQMLWRIEILHAGKAVGEVRAYLAQEQIVPGRFKASLSVSSLREALVLRLPDLSFAGVKWEGSTLVIDCRPALRGENSAAVGNGLDLIALEDGIITRVVARAGTPLVQAGQAVRRGDVLIKGEERGEGGTTHPLAAQGDVTARVWARGDAKASLFYEHTVETGEYRRRVMLCSPWSRKVVHDAPSFDLQDTSVRVERIVGLYLPVWREIETLARITVIREARDKGDAASAAQGAAEQEAKLKCPAGVEILDKWVDYSMIDNEFVCATVVLEYEHAIAGRAGTE